MTIENPLKPINKKIQSNNQGVVKVVINNPLTEEEKLEKSRKQPKLPEELRYFLETKQLRGKIDIRDLTYDQLLELSLTLEKLISAGGKIELYLTMCVECFNEMGNLKIKRKHLEEAEEYLIKALVINPNNLATLNYLGKLERRRENFEKAEKYFERVLKLDPNNSVALNSLSDIEKEKKSKSKHLENPLWQRKYSSLPINEMAEHGISDRKEIKKDKLKAKK